MPERSRTGSGRTTDEGTDQGGHRVAFVQASWHAPVVDRCRQGFLRQAAALGIPTGRIDCFTVPGAFEIPLHAQRLAGSGRYAAVVGAALVTDGGIYRHEFVAAAVVDGLMRVGLDTGVPVLSAVLTPHHFHDHEDHADFFARHLEVKGEEAALACASTLDSLARLPAA